MSKTKLESSSRSLSYQLRIYQKEVSEFLI